MYYVTIQNASGRKLIHTPEPSSTLKVLGKVTKAVNSIDRCDLTLYPTNPGWDAMTPIKTMVYVDDEQGNRTFTGRVLKPSGTMDSDGSIKRSYICEGELGYLCDTVQGYTQADTAAQFWAAVIRQHNSQADADKQFAVGNITITKEIISHTWSYVTSYKAIGDYINQYGGEFRLRYEGNTRYIDYTDTAFVAESNTPIDLGVNMRSVSREVDPSNIASGIFAAGSKLTNDGTSAERLELEEVIWSSELVAKYGKIVACVLWDDVTIASNLQTKAEQWLADQSTEITSYSINTIDLYELHYDFEAFEVGTVYPISNPLLGFTDEVRCIGKTIDINDPTQTTLQFGTKQASMSKITAGAANKTAQISQISSNVYYMQKDIAGVKADASGLAERVTANSNSITLLTADVTANTAAVTDHETRITELESEVSDQEAEIQQLTQTIVNSTLYSTLEHIIGTWIDGSYLYERTYVAPDVSTGAVLPLDITNLSEIVESRGQLIDGSSSEPFDDYSADGTDLTVGVGTGKAYITLKYVKNGEVPNFYGWHIDPNISDPAQAVTYLGNAIGKTPAAMGASSFSYGDWENAFFMPKPCMLRSDGTVAYYLDPNDYTKKADGTASDVANASFDGNAMMEWPLIWYKFEAGAAEGEGYFYCSDQQVDSSYKCWCNYDAKDNIIPHFYTAIYNGTIINNKMRSLSGLDLRSNGGTNHTGTQERTAALANNVNSETDVSPEWFTCVWSDYTLISALIILIGKSLDVQHVFGLGLTTGDSSASSGEYVTGTANTGGLFTGSTTSSYIPVKVFGIENWWGCNWRRIAGMSSSNILAYKLTYGTADESAAIGYSELDLNGYLPVRKNGVDVQAQAGFDYIKKMHFGKHGFIPIDTNGDKDQYWSAFGALANRSTAVVGGDNNPRSDNGAGLAVGVNNSFNANYAHIGTALSCKPLLQGGGA